MTVDLRKEAKGKKINSQIGSFAGVNRNSTSIQDNAQESFKNKIRHSRGKQYIGNRKAIRREENGFSKREYWPFTSKCSYFSSLLAILPIPNLFFSYIFHNNIDSCFFFFFCLAKQELFGTLKLDINQYSVWMCLFICSNLLADNSPDSVCSSRQQNYKPDQ